jgi:hypothetical protein
MNATTATYAATTCTAANPYESPRVPRGSQAEQPTPWQRTLRIGVILGLLTFWLASVAVAYSLGYLEGWHVAIEKNNEGIVLPTIPRNHQP